MVVDMSCRMSSVGGSVSSPIARSCCDIAMGKIFTLCDIAATSSNWTRALACMSPHRDGDNK